MTKLHRGKNNIVKNIKKTSNKALETVENTAKGIVMKSAPVIEKGISAVYGTMATGLDLGLKGAKTIAKGITKTKRKRSFRNRYRKGSKSRKFR